MSSTLAGSRLAVILVALVLACTSLSHIHATTTVRMIHPTIQRAHFGPPGDGNPGKTLLETDSRSLVSEENIYGSKKLEAIESTPKTEASASFLLPEGGGRASYITYAMEHEALESGARKIVGPGNSCHIYSAFRAYEMVVIQKKGENVTHAIGFTDNYACLIVYQPGFVPDATQALTSDKIASSKTYDMALLPGTRSQYALVAAAARVQQGKEQMEVTHFDEAGNIYDGYVDTMSTVDNKIVAAAGQNCLSTITLDQSKPCSYNDGSAESNLAKEAVANLKKHYDKSFVESIQFFDNALCWSTGWRIPTLARVRCIGAAYTTEKQIEYSVRAMETYSDGTSWYNHQLLSYHNLKENRTESTPRYVHKKTTSKEALKEEKNNPKPDKFIDQLLPVDIVYIERCKKLFAIYMHMYQEFKPSQRLNERSDYIPVNWMTFPVNAILYRNDRLYLFSSGNKLKITEPLPSNCDLANVKVMPENYYQSDFLLSSEAGLNRQPYKKLVPIYDSEKHTDGDGPLNLVNSYTEVPMNLRLVSANETVPDDPNNSNQTIPDGQTEAPPIPSNSSNSSMIIIVIVIIILVGIICGFIHFFYFTGAPEVMMKAKSIARKQLNQPTQMGSGKEAQQPHHKGHPPVGAPAARSGPAALSSGPPGSTLSPTLTVRSSDLHQLPGASKESVKSAKSVRLPTQSLKSTRSAKSTRSPGVKASKSVKSSRASPSSTPTGSPKSVSSLQSKGSHGVGHKRSKSATASGSKKASPKK